MFYLKNLFLILDDLQKKSAIKLFFLIIFGTLFEILGIGMVIPAVTLIINPELIYQYIENKELHLFITSLPDHYIIGIGLITIIILYFLKTIFLIYLVWHRNKFAFKVLAEISKKLFNKYLNREWSESINSSSSTLIRNCNTEPAIFVNNIVMPIIELTAEIMVLIGILTLLLLIEPIVTVINFSIFCLFAIIYHKFFKNKALKLGKLRQDLESKKIKHLQHGFSALRDIKILNRENFFLKNYNIPNQQSRDVITKWTTIQALPRLILEFVAVLCLTAVVLGLILQDPNFDQIIPSLAMFGAASMRLLPSSNRILGALQNLRFGRASIDLIKVELLNVKKINVQKSDKSFSFKNDITLDKINFEYKKGSDLILKDISMKILKGKFVGIIGESGSGKSTVIDIILGLLNPRSGSIKIDGLDVGKKIKSWQKLIGYVPQDIYLIDDTLRQNIAFGVPHDQIEDEKVIKAIKSAQLEKFVSNLENGLDTFFGERGVKLSGGQLQRIAIARALYRDPDILVLDEATSALDNQTESFVMDAVKKLKGHKTIIIIAHRLSTIKYCDYLYKLCKGKIIEEGEPLEILKNGL